MEIINTKKIHNVEKVLVTSTKLQLNVNGKDIAFDLTEVSNKLSKANEVERNYFQVDECGYGIHWPLIDEDLSINGLLGIQEKPPVSFLIAG